MDISVIIIGDEILLGQVTDTNSGMIARTIAPAGWQLSEVVTVGDSGDDIRRAVTEAMDRSDIVLTTGGLGPTKDDITKTILLEIFGGEMVWNKDVLAFLEEFTARKRFTLNELTRRQALVPSSCNVIRNDYGTAPVMEFVRGNKTLISLPGVPSESTALMKNVIFPRLYERYGAGKAISHRTLLVFGITESDLAERLAGFESALPENMHLAYLPMTGYHRLRLDGFGDDAVTLESGMDEIFSKLKTMAGHFVFWDKDMTVPEIVLELLGEKGYTLSTAESCTGGNIAHSITMIPGSSSVFKGSVVAYDNKVKVNVLGVDATTINRYGAVSLPVVEQMSAGAKTVIGTDCAVATSGIAGPGGGTESKPVGTVCISVCTPEETLVDHFFFGGSRRTVIERSTNTALIKLIRLLQGTGRMTDVAEKDIQSE